MNWAGVVVGVGASFCGRGLFRDGPDQGMWRLVNARQGIFGASFCGRGLFRDGQIHANSGKGQLEKNSEKGELPNRP